MKFEDHDKRPTWLEFLKGIFALEDWGGILSDSFMTKLADTVEYRLDEIGLTPNGSLVSGDNDFIFLINHGDWGGAPFGQSIKLTADDLMEGWEDSPEDCDKVAEKLEAMAARFRDQASLNSTKPESHS
jgi:hypothetical protein